MKIVVQYADRTATFPMNGNVELEVFRKGLEAATKGMAAGNSIMQPSACFTFCYNDGKKVGMINLSSAMFIQTIED